MELKPSEIFYSQDSINNRFDQKSGHGGDLIGETLDDIYEGRCSVYSIPTITVTKREDKWVTHDNRRLWVFRQLESLGKCNTVRVQVGAAIPSNKYTSNNGGVDINVRGNPGGTRHKNTNIIPKTTIFRYDDSSDESRNPWDEYDSYDDSDDDYLW